MKKTILVTGGTGFIGSHTTVELQAAGYNVVIIDNLSNSKAEVIDGIEKISGTRPAFEQVDCCDSRHRGHYSFCRFESCGRVGGKALEVLSQQLRFADQPLGVDA